ncbi:MAG: 50S ribosomal protein L17 [Bacteroidales bacterium]|nr:50S ribosomal protein L17 [Bacteroidales bacterium]
MRHLKTINHLGRTSSHRKAMLSNMATSLIIHKRITTTTAKAKALRKYVEPLITKAKDDSTHSRRVVFSYLQDKEAVTELFREISPKIADRPGGYTRILKTGNRLGDNAEMCIIELVDFNELMLEKTQAGKARSTRRRRSSRKKAEETTVTKTRGTKVRKEDQEAAPEAGPEATAGDAPEAAAGDAPEATDAAAEAAPEATDAAAVDAAPEVAAGDTPEAAGPDAGKESDPQAEGEKQTG